MSEEKTDLQQLNESIALIDALIEKKTKLVTFAKSEAYNDVLVELYKERDAAIEDYMKNNTPRNQAYSQFWNYLCNLLELLKTPTELDNLLNQKEQLAEQIAKLKAFNQEQGFGQQRGGAL